MLLQRKIENVLAAPIRVLGVLLLSLALISMGLNLFLGPQASCDSTLSMDPGNTIRLIGD